MQDRERATNSAMLIRKPVSEVFAAFINPEITTNFWFSDSTGKLEKGKTLVWSWAMYGVSTEVKVEEIIEDRLIKFSWEGPAPKVEIEFEPMQENSCYVTIKNYGCKLEGHDLVMALVDQSCGFTTLLDGLKAYMEYGLKLNLVADKFPHMRKEA